MKTDKGIKLIQKRAIDKVDKVLKELYFPDTFLKASKEGYENKLQYEQLEYKKFSEDWIVNIESFFPSLDNIIRNIKNALKVEQEILPVEITRRTNSESIRHLLRNTRFIVDINEQGDVRPDRVLNALSEIDYGIYENRFIATLINRLYGYLLDRSKAIEENISGVKRNQFKSLNTFKINDVVYNMKVDIDCEEDYDTTLIHDHNKKIFEKTSNALKIVSMMMNSEFMRTMSRYPPVKPPILKTQIIIKNPDFKNAYLLWLYLDKLHVLDYTLETQQFKNPLNNKYVKQLDQSLMMLFTTVFVNCNLGNNIENIRKMEIQSISPKPEDINVYANNLQINPPELKLEPQLASEYFLQQSKQLMEKNVKFVQTDKGNEKESLKQILLDQYSIADQIFNFYFGVDTDADVFDQLPSHKDPTKKYEQALEKHAVVKSAREVKEQILLDSVVLEDRWINEIKYLQKLAIELYQEKQEQETQQKIEAMIEDADEYIKQTSHEEDSKKYELLLRQITRNTKELEQLREKHKEEVRKIKAEQNKLIREEQFRQEQRVQKEIIEIREKRKTDINEELMRLMRKAQQRKQKELKNHLKTTELIKKQTKQKIDELALK